MKTVFSKFFPSYEYEFEVDLFSDKIIRILNDNIQPEKIRIGVLKKETDKLFEGRIDNELYEFKCRKITYQAQSFKPEITGKWVETENGSLIKIDMEINQAIKLFFSIFIILVVFATIAIIVAVFSGDIHFLAILTPFLFFLFGIILIHVGFDFWKNAVIKDFREIFDA